MKNILFISLIVLVSLFLPGCSSETYLFKNSVDEIVSIEIVSAESSLEYTVIKTLSETEKDDFLKQLQMIKFNNYYVGDPMSVNGDAVKITYQNGDYEMICFFWAEYVKDGEISFIRKSCNEKDFTELLNNFLE